MPVASTSCQNRWNLRVQSAYIAADVVYRCKSYTGWYFVNSNYVLLEINMVAIGLTK